MVYKNHIIHTKRFPFNYALILHNKMDVSQSAPVLSQCAPYPGTLGQVIHFGKKYSTDKNYDDKNPNATGSHR